MAIYTQYGRYLKAKMFKQMLDESGDTYMLFGMGNPKWDENNAIIPQAPYCASAVYDSSTTQFADTNIRQYYMSYNNVIDVLKSSDSPGEPSNNTFAKKCVNLLPVFPAIWCADEDTTIMTLANTDITINEFHLYYVADNTLYKWDSTSNTFSPGTAILPAEISALTSDTYQYYTELCLRGKAITLSTNNVTPVGLLGALKCNVSYVKDIGSDANTTYTGNANQFWYGDRYWETVDPADDKLENYITSNNGDDKKEKIYPHHLLITSTVNPRQLCDDLVLDHYIMPRQIALYVRNKKANESSAPPNVYRVGEYIFNFGQLSQEDVSNMSTEDQKRVLNFTLPCTITDNLITRNFVDGDFKFILHDYVKGTTKSNHSVDRFGYVIGF